jgi:hypothetical protein
MSHYLFFRSSRNAYQQVAELFDFVWPTATALWNLRWQVQGLANSLGSADQEVLHGRFVEGSGIHGANLKLACIDMSWAKQQQQFAKFLLVDLFAVYEGWLETTLTSVGMKPLLSNFQSPSDLQRPSAGYAGGLTRLSSASSPMLTSAFYDPLKRHFKNSLSKLNELFIAYRFFKELRNSLMHRGGNADDRVISAYTLYAGLTAQDLKAKEVPEVHAPVLDNGIELSLRGVVGFADVIRRLIATLDAEFACVTGAQAEVVAQWRDHFQATSRTKKKFYTLPSAAGEREKMVRRLIVKIGLPRPVQVSLLGPYLLSQHLVT